MSPALFPTPKQTLTAAGVVNYDMRSTVPYAPVDGRFHCDFDRHVLLRGG